MVACNTFLHRFKPTCEFLAQSGTLAVRNGLLSGRWRRARFVYSQTSVTCFRLGFVSISLPALKDREDDVLLLAHSFLQRAVKENSKMINGFTQPALAANSAYLGRARCGSSKTGSRKPSSWPKAERSLPSIWS